MVGITTIAIDSVFGNAIGTGKMQRQRLVANSFPSPTNYRRQRAKNETPATTGTLTSPSTAVAFYPVHPVPRPIQELPSCLGLEAFATVRGRAHRSQQLLETLGSSNAIQTAPR